MSEKPTYEELEQKVSQLEQVKIDRKRAEEALQEAEEKFRNIAENSLVGVYIIQDGIFKYVNTKFADIFGYSVEECLSNMHIRQTVHPEDLDFVQEQISKRVSGQVNSVNYAFRGIKKDGTTIHVEIFGSSILLNRKSSVTGSLLDITKRKQVEERLRESDERYRGLFERSLDLVYLCDFEGNFIDANDAALEGLGYTKKDIKSLNFMSLLDKDQLPRAIEVVEEMLKTGSQKSTAEFQLKRKDGKHIYIESKGAIIYRDGKPFAIQGVARNITERKKLEEEREKMIYELRQALKEVKQLGGLLPICSHCKKIRDDKGYWNQIEAYIQDHSDAEFSHSICQECAKKYYPDMDIYDDNGEVTQD
jgi:PAS domain S-box-containing protein